MPGLPDINRGERGVALKIADIGTDLGAEQERPRDQCVLPGGGLPDGIHGKEIDVPLIPSSDEGNFSYNQRDGLFIHTLKRGGPYGRSVALATSRDFQNWTDTTSRAAPNR